MKRVSLLLTNILFVKVVWVHKINVKESMPTHPTFIPKHTRVIRHPLKIKTFFFNIFSNKNQLSRRLLDTLNKYKFIFKETSFKSFVPNPIPILVGTPTSTLTDKWGSNSYYLILIDIT